MRRVLLIDTLYRGPHFSSKALFINKCCAALCHTSFNIFYPTITPAFNKTLILRPGYYWFFAFFSALSLASSRMRSNHTLLRHSIPVRYVRLQSGWLCASWYFLRAPRQPKTKPARSTVMGVEWTGFVYECLFLYYYMCVRSKSSQPGILPGCKSRTHQSRGYMFLYYTFCFWCHTWKCLVSCGIAYGNILYKYTESECICLLLLLSQD